MRTMDKTRDVGQRANRVLERIVVATARRSRPSRARIVVADVQPQAVRRRAAAPPEATAELESATAKQNSARRAQRWPAHGRLDVGAAVVVASKALKAARFFPVPHKFTLGLQPIKPSEWLHVPTAAEMRRKRELLDGTERSAGPRRAARLRICAARARGRGRGALPRARRRRAERRRAARRRRHRVRGPAGGRGPLADGTHGQRAGC